MKLFSSKLILFSLISGSVLTPLNASNIQTFWNPQGEKQKNVLHGVIDFLLQKMVLKLKPN